METFLIILLSIISCILFLLLSFYFTLKWCPLYDMNGNVSYRYTFIRSLKCFFILMDRNRGYQYYNQNGILARNGHNDIVIV